MFFSCKVCAEKDKRIEELHAQVKFLKSMLSSPSNPGDVTAYALEADGILSAQQHILDVEIPDSEQFVSREADNELSERDKLLSGNYS